MTGRIVLASTPIGNADDASARLRDALASFDLIAAEDTRRVRDLARRMGVAIGGEVIALHDHNEGERAAGLVARAADGASVLIVSDAGTPTISDPGFRVVELAAAEGVRVSVLPGPSAAIAALAVSGLPTDRFCFEGFLSRKAGERAATLGQLARERRTLVFFEAPHRLATTLEAMSEAFGPERAAAVCRELTKTHEEVRRGPLAELARWASASDPRGEIAIVVAGAPATLPRLGTLVDEVLSRVGGGERLKDAALDVAGAAGASSRELYAAALAARHRA